MFDWTGVNLNVVAMALAGFTDDKNTMWKEMCSDLLSTITHPYLKAIFYFLTTSSESYESIFVRIATVIVLLLLNHTYMMLI